MFALLALALLTDTHADDDLTCVPETAPTLAGDLGTFLDDKGRAFVGCRRSAGECQSSCPERNGEAELDAGICPEGSYEGSYACYCPTGEPEVPDLGELPEGAQLIGCRPSPGECINSCPTRQGRWVEDPSICDPDDPFSSDGGGACYCF